MIHEKECPNCGMVYEIRADVLDISDQTEEWSIDEETFEDEMDEIYPEYCPFCGSHEEEELEEERP